MISWERSQFNSKNWTQELKDDCIAGLDDLRIAFICSGDAIAELKDLELRLKEMENENNLKYLILAYLNSKHGFINPISRKQRFRLSNSSFNFVNTPNVEIPMGKFEGCWLLRDEDEIVKIRIECNMEMGNYLIGYHEDNWGRKIIAVFKIPDELIFYIPRDWQNHLISTIRMHLPLWAMRFFPEAEQTKYIVKRNRMKLEEVK